MFNLEWSSLPELITRALHDGVIDSYHLHPDHLEVRLGGTPIHVRYPHAPAFFLDLLGGTDRNVQAPLDARPAEGDSFSSPVSLSVGRPVFSEELDDLLRGAFRLGLIEGGELDASTDVVLLHLPACSCTMPRPEALAFLSASIHEELRRRLRGRSAARGRL